MTIDTTERKRVRVEQTQRPSLFHWKWRQRVVVGEGADNEQVIELKTRKPEELQVLVQALKTVVITHEVSEDTAASPLKHKSAQALRIQAQKDNNAARTFLAEHGIRLRGFDLPEPLIGHVR